MRRIKDDGTVIEVCEGWDLLDKVPPKAKDTPQAVTFDGVNGQNAPDSFGLTEKLLGQHLMLVGGIGSGKTNTFNLLLSSLTPKLKSNDVMIIFDTKGDFYREFYKPGDVVISNDDKMATGKNGKDYWNILNEIENDDHLEENIIEISRAIFADKIEKTSNVFFPSAAKDIFGAALYHFIQCRNELSSSNETIASFFREAGIGVINQLLKSYDRFKAMQSYVSPSAPEQALGVLAELQQAVRELFIGNFAKKGTLSLRQLVREKGGRKIFIEYDIGVGGMLGPIYSLMFDLAIKEALCRGKSDGNVYFVVDEFKLLPHLHHLDDAVNFGRSLGIKFMIGIQNVDQIIQAYGENGAMNMFSGFTNQFAFSVSDYSTRNYIKERAGTNKKQTSIKNGNLKDKKIDDAHVVEDWDISSLKLGQAVISLNGVEPFLFRFKEYKK